VDRIATTQNVDAARNNRAKTCESEKIS